MKTFFNWLLGRKKHVLIFTKEQAAQICSSVKDNPCGGGAGGTVSGIVLVSFAKEE